MTSLDPRPNNRRGTIGVRRLETLVTERDLELLRALREYRLLTTAHLRDLFFSSHRTPVASKQACHRTLNRLSSYRLISATKRGQGGIGGGGLASVWMLGAAGERLLRHVEGHGDQRRKPRFDPSHTFFDHTLEVADAAVRLVQASRAGLFELLEIRGEPRNWRSFPGAVGGVRIVKPDLAVVTASGEFEDHWFIEVDRGTESTKTLIKKCHVYTDYQRSGIEQQRSGVYPRVLWLLPTKRRVELLRGAIEKERGLDPELFLVRTTDELVAAIAATTQTAEASVSAQDPARGSNN
jgi:hypothetical protein